MEYVFRITPLDKEALAPQVSRALERRMEIFSRRRCPGLWSAADRLRRAPRVFGGTVPRRRRYVRRALGVLCLVLGIILIVPGLMEPRELSLLLPGIFGAAVGLMSLFGGVRPRRNSCSAQAERLLEGRDRIPAGEFPRAVFAPEGMVLENGSVGPNAQRKTVSYGELTGAFECEDIFLVTYGERAAVLLQKRDLAGGDTEGFWRFLSRHTACERCLP